MTPSSTQFDQARLKEWARQSSASPDESEALELDELVDLTNVSNAFWFDAALAAYEAVRPLVPPWLVIVATVLLEEESPVRGDTTLPEIRRHVHSLSPPALYILSEKRWQEAQQQGVWTPLSALADVPGDWWLRHWTSDGDMYQAIYGAQDGLGGTTTS
jgi:hypothetical protein